MTDLETTSESASDKLVEAPNGVPDAVPEKNLGGRPMIVLTDDQRKQVELLAPYMTTEQIAASLKIAKPTFFALLERDEEVSELYKKGKADKIGNVASSLVGKALDGDTTAAIFFLKTQGGWSENKLRTGEKPQIQINVNSLAEEKEVQPIIDVQAIDVDE